MGTRAAFWVGDPRKVDERKWLGCIAYDGHTENFPYFSEIKTAGEFEAYVKGMASYNDHFSDPDKGGWPFPWQDDIFITDLNYAFFDGKVHMASFHEGFYEYSIEWPTDGEEENDSLEAVPAPSEYDRTQPDSIMMLRVGG